jgi:3-dehydroquinate synthase
MNLRTRHRLGSYELKFLSKGEMLSDLPSPFVIVTDAHVARLLPSSFDYLIVPAGERSKSFPSYRRLIDSIAERGHGRNLTLVAVGGGVVGDLVGFAAATYMRGVRYIQVPTTVLAQVDSSVGGKVGIDLPAGKNLLGAFYPPNEVRLCLDFLESLPSRQLANGMAEVLKYGFIMRPSILELARSGVTEELIRECIRCKIEVVEEDELETTGLRAILNFGHTVGHALEAELAYKGLLHGEAISIGMVAEALLGEQLGITEAGTSKVVMENLARMGLPTAHGLLATPERLIPWMRRDKKRLGLQLTFSLLTRVGCCELVSNVSEESLTRALLAQSRLA